VPSDITPRPARLQAPALPTGLAALAGQARQSLRAHIWFLLPIMAYGVLLQTLAARLGTEAPLSLSLYSKVFGAGFPLFAIAFALGRTGYVMAVVRPERLGRYLVADLRFNVLTAERVLNALIIFLALPVFTSMFTSVKAMIPLLQPFAWDTTFAGWDAFLHGGRQAWEWLHPILGTPLVTAAVNVVYVGWFFVLYGVWMWQAFSTRDRVLRMRFFLSFILMWILLGTGLATLLSSAGPCYFGRVTGLEDSFAPLMSYLREASTQAPVWAIQTQENLWRDYLSPGLELGSGISAMPSMHVATTVLFALLGWQVSRRLGIAFTAFAVAIMIGSVHLGWHYALDGYVSAIGTVLIWKLAGWLVARDPIFRTASRAPARI
jgi:hypothetical protein